MSEGGLNRNCKRIELEMEDITINRSAGKSICKMGEKAK